MMLALALLSSPTVQAKHYYGGGNPIALTIDSSKVLIRFAPDLNSLEQFAVLGEIDRIAQSLPD
jgi:hypothetical protein